MSGLIVAFSGGKDSTAMALRLHQLGEPFRMLYTATGNELPEVREHIDAVQKLTGAHLIDLAAPTLDELIREQHALPNWRMRWCTRMIKIEPCAKWLRDNPGNILAVGLRADEDGRAGGGYDTECRYPLREWNWGLSEVVNFNARCGIVPPERTDCAVCFYQTLHEWYSLWTNHPDYWAEGEAWEAFTGYTFRSEGRDTWPASMAGLRAEFEGGRIPKQRQRKVSCRVCNR